MNIFMQIDVHIIALLLSLILMGITIKQGASGSIQKTLFLCIQIALSIMLILEMTSWILDGSYGSNDTTLNKVVNALFLGLNPLFACIWLMYLHYYFNKDASKLKKIIPVVVIPLLGTLALNISSIWTGTVFFINENNEYIRGDWFPLLAASMFAMTGAALIYILYHRKKLTTTETISFCIFHFIPIASAIAQVLFYGLSLVWPSTVVAFLLIFIFIELRDLQKDPLTGINNRRQLEEQLAIQLARKKEFSLIMIDVDDFKAINDNFGHIEGDKALQEVSQILSNCLRQNDFVARYAGDEFIIMLNHIAATKHVVSRIHQKLEDGDANRSYKLRISCGFAASTEINYQDASHLFKLADERMYENKKVSRK